MTAGKPWSEQYRVEAAKWVKLDSAARLLEDNKPNVFAQIKTRIMAESNENLSEAKAERLARTEPEWTGYVKEMCDARTKANEAKVNVEWCRMRFSEWMSADATARAEMKL